MKLRLGRVLANLSCLVWTGVRHVLVAMYCIHCHQNLPQGKELYGRMGRVGGWAHVCLPVCLYVRTYTCIHVRTCLSACLSVRTYVRTHVYTCAYTLESQNNVVRPRLSGTLDNNRRGYHEVYSDCEVFGLKKHGLKRPDCIHSPACSNIINAMVSAKKKKTPHTTLYRLYMWIIKCE